MSKYDPLWKRIRGNGRTMIANVITGCRILFSIIILLAPVFSPVFCGCYLAAGFTDMIDGTIVRKLGTESEFGSKLDTIADIVFVAVGAYKVLPVMEIPKSIWIWTGVIALVKIINIISSLSGRTTCHHRTRHIRRRADEFVRYLTVHRLCCL